MENLGNENDFFYLYTKVKTQAFVLRNCSNFIVLRKKEISFCPGDNQNRSAVKGKILLPPHLPKLEGEEKREKEEEEEALDGT